MQVGVRPKDDARDFNARTVKAPTEDRINRPEN